MKIFIGADHRGYKFKEEIIKVLKKKGYSIVDAGTFTDQSPCDYPAIAFRVAREVTTSKDGRGILVCMSGIGHTIAANKVSGAYAALCYNKRSAVLSREHNNSNILVLGAKFVKKAEVPGIITAWLKTRFAGGRHLRRFRQIQNIEKHLLAKRSQEH